MCYVVSTFFVNEDLTDVQVYDICYLHDKDAAETFSLDVQLKTGLETRVRPMHILDARREKIPYVEKVIKKYAY